MLQEIRLAELVPSPTNPRKTFDQVKLQELARSIGEVGVLEPILVRSLTDGRRGETADEAIHRVAKTVHGAQYEVVAGERRYRAAKLAANGNADSITVPCIVKELTDVEVLEIQVIENEQRDDLHAMEEAEGYAALMKEAGYDVARIAERIGKSEKYVYDRIKLLQLIPELQQVFLEDEITAGHAILLARLSKDEQKRALGDDDTLGGWNSSSGLFTVEHAETTPGLELDDQRRGRKAVSVRELESWINKNVRFRPEEVDLPNLFPETAAALQTAEEEELKVIKITYDHQLKPETREEGERTYSRQSWKRADGKVDHEDYSARKQPSKECDHSVLGVVVAGRGRGQAIRVCIARKKCEVHWRDEVRAARAAEKAAKEGKATAPTAQKPSQPKGIDKYEQQRREREAERKRWDKAEPKLLEALAEKMAGADAVKLMPVLVKAWEELGYSSPSVKKLMKPGKTVEDAIRYCAFLMLSEAITDHYGDPTEAAKTLKPWGIDVAKIVDEAAPQEKTKPAAAAKKKPATKARKKAPAKA